MWLLDGHPGLGKQVEMRDEEGKFVVSGEIRQTL